MYTEFCLGKRFDPRGLVDFMNTGENKLLEETSHLCDDMLYTDIKETSNRSSSADI